MYLSFMRSFRFVKIVKNQKNSPELKRDLKLRSISPDEVCRGYSEQGGRKAK